MELVRLRSEVWSAYQVENIVAAFRRLFDGLGLLPPVFECEHAGGVWILSTNAPAHMANAIRGAMKELNKFDLCPLCGAEHPEIACPLREII